MFIYSSVIYSEENTHIFNPDNAVALGKGTAGNSIIGINGTSANVTVSAANTHDFVDNSNSDIDSSPNKGTHSNFNAQQYGPDSIYDTLTEGGMSPFSYYPSNYVPNGGTQFKTGTLGDLQSDNSAYMSFSAYVSATSSTAKTDAYVAYRDSTTSPNTPKERAWTGETAKWGSQSEMPTADSPVRFVRVAYSPIETRSFEKIVITLSDDGNLDAYVFDGTKWTTTNNIASTGTTVNAYKCYDVAYEMTSGRALLVYSRGTTTNEIGYKIWTYGVGWGTEQLLDLPYTSNRVRWIDLASSPGTRSGSGDDNEIALIYLTGGADVHGYNWSGSGWSLMGATAVWDATAALAGEECIAVAYEQSTGEAMFIWADSVSTDFYYKTWDGATLSANTLLAIPAAGAVGNWVTLKVDPTSDDLFFTVVDGAQDLNTAYWNGSVWAVHAEHDGTVSTDGERCADFAWEPTGGKGLLVWGTTAGQIAYKTFISPNTWGPQQNVAMGTNIHRWVQLRTNPRTITGDMLVIGAVLEGTTFDLGSIRWDGTTLTVIGSSSLSSDTTTTAYECFELEFQLFGPPSEFTVDIEFTANSNSDSWDRLIWTTDSSFTTLGVTATFQLWNYSLGNYPSVGNGFAVSTIGTTDVTQSQTISDNPTQFRDASGNWKLRIRGVKSTSTIFDWKGDLISYAPRTLNYELDLEEQWTNTDYNQTNEQLCIYGGTMGSESLMVDVWTGSSWQNVIASLNNGWNNISVSSYLTSSTFTIRFKGSTETGDTTQDSWNIDATILHCWSNNYDYILSASSQKTYDQNITLTLNNYNNINRLNNCTVWFHDGVQSVQIKIINGVVTQSSGQNYLLPASSSLYIAVYVEQNSVGTSTLYLRLEAKTQNSIVYTCSIELRVT
jgi:hypothetical protein